MILLGGSGCLFGILDWIWGIKYRYIRGKKIYKDYKIKIFVRIIRNIEDIFNLKGINKIYLVIYISFEDVWLFFLG